MTDELNLHFSAVFTREGASSLPVPDTRNNVQWTWGKVGGS